MIYFSTLTLMNSNFASFAITKKDGIIYPDSLVWTHTTRICTHHYCFIIICIRLIQCSVTCMTTSFRRDIFQNWTCWTFSVRINISINPFGWRWRGFGFYNDFIAQGFPSFYLKTACSTGCIHYSKIRNITAIQSSLSRNKKPFWKFSCHVITIPF